MLSDKLNIFDSQYEIQHKKLYLHNPEKEPYTPIGIVIKIIKK